MSANPFPTLFKRDKRKKNIQIHSLIEARKYLHSYVIMLGDWGKEMYLICPIYAVHCNEDELKAMLYSFEKHYFGMVEHQAIHLKYEILEPGCEIEHNYELIPVNGSIWFNPELDELRDKSVAVLRGKKKLG